MDAIDGAHAKITNVATVKNMVVILYFIHAPILVYKSLSELFSLTLRYVLDPYVGFECNSGGRLSYFWTDRTHPPYFLGNLQIVIQMPAFAYFV